MSARTELIARIREVVARTACTVAPDDMPFVISVLMKHYDWPAKVGRGIASIEVRNNGGNRGFWIVRTDGSAIDISWVVAMNGKPSAKADTVTAARTAIASQVAAVPVTVGAACTLCGKPLTAHDTTHVDHEIPFDTLFSQWLAAHGLTYADVQSIDTGTRRVMSDPVQVVSWMEWHALHAKLRVVHSVCNLSRGRSNV